MKQIWMAIFVLGLLQPLTTGELYSAMAGMEKLVDSQKSICNIIDTYIESTESKLQRIKKVKKEYSSLLQASSRDFPDFVSNPINAFVLIKKLTVDWDEAKEDIIHCLNKDFLATSERMLLPDQNDLSGAAKALLRLQHIYNLNTKSVAEGKLIGPALGLSLTTGDCFELGRQAFNSGYFDHAISWLEEANRKFTMHSDSLRNSSEILKYLTLSTFEKGRNSVLFFTNSLLQLGLFQNMDTDIVANTDDNSKDDDLNSEFFSQTNPIDEANYQNLCQVEKTSEMDYHPHLKCHLTSNHPFLTLCPIKEEQLHLNPKISLYYDVVSARDIETMKSLALPSLQRAEVAEYSGTVGHRVSDNRVTQIAWLRVEDHPLIGKLYRRIEDVCGLSSESAEPFQMANYGLGGHFHLHMDVLPNSETYFGPDMGNRIATWMFYLSDVDGGGATVFPRLNLTVFPKKGAALFWHNVKSNGVGDVLTLHGACPVVTGSKWVTNVWFHERGQEFRLKCGMKPQSSLQPYYRFKK